MDVAPTFRCRKLGEMPISKCLRNQREWTAFFGSAKKAEKCGSCPCDQGKKIMEGKTMAERECEKCGRTIYSGKFCSVCQQVQKVKETFALAPSPIPDETKSDILSKPTDNPPKQEAAPPPPPKRKQKKVTRPCANCGRDLPIIGKGMCGGCYNIVRITPQEALAEALKDAAERFTGEAPSIKGRRPSGTPGLLPKESLPEPAPEKPVPTVHDPSTTTLSLLFITEQDKRVRDFLQGLADKNRRTVPQQVLWMVECQMAAEREGAAKGSIR